MQNLIAQLAVLACCVGAASAQNVDDRVILVRSMLPDAPGASVQAYGITREDLRLIKSRLPTDSTIIPIRDIPKQRVRVGDRTVESTIRGTTDNYRRGTYVEVVRGRFLIESDVAPRNNVAVIPRQDAEALFAQRDPIGDAIQFSDEFFTVVGVVETDGPPSIFIPFTTMRSRLGDQTISRKAGMFEISQYELSQIKIILPTKADVPQALEAIRRILRENHNNQDYEVTVNP